MSRQTAERFEQSIERGSQGGDADGRLALLVETAQQTSILGEPLPSAPRNLVPGRQRLLSETAYMRARITEKPRRRIQMMGIMKPAIALLAVLVLFGSVFGVGQAAADSLPGDPLYGLKLAAEEARLGLTTDPQASADLNLALAEERLDEVVALLEQGQVVDETTTGRVEQQLATTLETALQLEDPQAIEALHQLATAIEQRQRTMQALMGESPEPPVRQLIREMERVRTEAHAGQGDPDGVRERVRHGTPPEATAMPDPTMQPGPGPRKSQPTEQPGDSPGPQPTRQPGGEEDQPGEMPSEPGPHGTKAPGSGGGAHQGHESPSGGNGGDMHSKP
jgi:hypothetical protein